MHGESKPSKRWLPPLVGLVSGVIAFAAVFSISNNLIGGAGVGMIVFAVTWRQLRTIRGL